MTDPARKARALILTTPIGGGHLAVAHALGSQLTDAGHDAVIASPLTDSRSLSRIDRAYQMLVTRMPAVWAAYYYGRAVFPFNEINAKSVQRALAAPLRAVNIETFDYVFLTSSLYAHCLPQFAGRTRTGVVVTDLFGGPREWFRPGADVYFVPSPRMQEIALSQGLAPSRVSLRRLPAAIAPTRAAEACMRDRPHVLVVGGSEGVGPIEAVASGIARSRVRPEVTVVCGHNKSLRRRLQRVELENFHVHGFVPRLGELLNQYDAVVTKPGSVTVMEALNGDVPFALMPGIPGIERPNFRTLTKLSQIPRINDADTARNFMDKHFAPSGGLTLDGHRWGQAVAAVHAALPRHLLCLTDLGESKRQSGPSGRVRAAAS